jgi:hypothetical protein
MRTDYCTGPSMDPLSGGWYCRHNADAYPENGDWEDHCQLCRIGREHDQELRGDCDRDES